MLFLDSSEHLGDFVVNLLYALGCLIGTTHFTTSPDPPQSKFAAEVGVLSGVSYEQPIGGKFSLVGKAGVTMLDQGNPWAYSGFQPAAELGLRWYFSGVSPSNANNYNPQNEKLHRIKTKSCLAENETSPIKLHPTLAQ